VGGKTVGRTLIALLLMKQPRLIPVKRIEVMACRIGRGIFARSLKQVFAEAGGSAPVVLASTTSATAPGAT
jgi:hypothetical protein